MPGYKVYLQDGGDIGKHKGLLCGYCKLLLKNPVQTSKTGKRLCRECFEIAIKDPASGLDQNDEARPDTVDIANLKVKCENYMFGCNWEGLFNQLMQHSQQCQYVTVECRNPGCGQRVLLTKMEIHLKQECPRQHVNCKDCGKEMHFIELKDYTGECPNAPKTCKNCKKKIPASKLADHMIYECTCKHVRCVCKNDGKTYEAGSAKFHSHLQDVSKLADHLEPMICEFTKMSEAFKEMSTAYQQATKRIDELEKGHQEDVQRIVMLEKDCDNMKYELMKTTKQTDKKIKIVQTNFEKRNDTFEKKVEELEKQNKDLSKLCDKSCSDVNDVTDKMQKIKNDVWRFESSLNDMKIVSTKDHYEYLARLQDMKISAAIQSGNQMMPYEKPSEFMKQLEDKVLEVERILNFLSVHHSELELQLQASLASTHNGAFLWRIPEVRRVIRDAKIGRINSIYSSPFYTGRNGYKMCIRVFLNGDGSGKGTHLSIFFVLMRGEYDPLLQWPFEPKVSLILVDQDHKKHLVQTLKPDPQLSSFQRPKTDMNVASGYPEFANLSVLENTSYVKDDIMYIKAVVDTSKIFHP